MQNTEITHLPKTDCDAGQIEQIFVNLVQNAGEALNERKGVVRIETGACRLEHGQAGPFGNEIMGPGQFVYAKVTDTGVGIDEATQAKIFDPFFTTKSFGRGLGLAAVFGIVRQHKGLIQVVSEPGKGSTFQFFLPVATEMQNANPLPQEPECGSSPDIVH